MVEVMTSTLLPGGDYLDQVRATIRAFGWAIQHTYEPGFDVDHAYTVGMTALGGPEVLVAGLPAPDAAALLNRVAPLLMSGQVPVGSHFVAPVGAGERAAHTVVHAGGLPLVAIALYGEAVRCVEVVLA